MSWKSNPYDEPEEVFDAWVAGLEAKIANALHPPRQKLFPDPEPVVLPSSLPSAARALKPSLHQAQAAAVPPPSLGARDDSAEDDSSIGYPELVQLSSGEKGKARDDGRDMGHADAVETIDLTSDDDDDDGGGGWLGDELIDESEEEEGSLGLSSGEDEDEEMEGEDEEEGQSEEDEEAVYDSDGDVVPRRVKTLLDFEAAQAPGSGSGSNDQAGGKQLESDGELDSDDMYEADDDVLPPLDALPSSALGPSPAPPRQSRNAAAAVPEATSTPHFVSALSLPLRRASPPPQTKQGFSSLRAAAPAPAPEAEPEVFELSDSDDHSTADEDEPSPAQKRPSAALEADTEDESMEYEDESKVDDHEDERENPLQSQSGEEDELEGSSQSGEELDDEHESALTEGAASLVQDALDLANPHQDAQPQDVVDYSVHPPLPDGYDLAQQVDYSIHPPLPDAFDASYPADRRQAEEEAPPAQTFEVDPSLLGPTLLAPLPTTVAPPILLETSTVVIAAKLTASANDPASSTALSFAAAPPALQDSSSSHTEKLTPPPAAGTADAPVVLAASDSIQALSSPSALPASAAVTVPSSPAPPPAAETKDARFKVTGDDDGGAHSGFTPETSLAPAAEAAPAAADQQLPDAAVEDVDDAKNDDADVDVDDGHSGFTPELDDGEEDELDGSHSAFAAETSAQLDQAPAPVGAIEAELDAGSVDELAPDVQPARETAEMDADVVVTEEAAPVSFGVPSPPLPAVTEPLDGPSPAPGATEEVDDPMDDDENVSTPVLASQLATAGEDEEEDELEGSEGSSDGIEVIGMPDADGSSTSDMDEEDETEAGSSSDAGPSDGESDDEVLASLPASAPARQAVRMVSTSNVAATFGQSNPFDALSVEGLSSEDESGSSARSASGDEDDDNERESTLVQTLEVPDKFDFAAVDAPPPTLAAPDSVDAPARNAEALTSNVNLKATPAVDDAAPSERSTPPSPGTEPLKIVVSREAREDEEPILPPSPVQDEVELPPSPLVEQESLPFTSHPPRPSIQAPSTSSPLLPASPPLPPAAGVPSLSLTPQATALTPTGVVDELEVEHDAFMQPTPDALLDVEIQVAEEHTEDLTVAAQHSLDQVEREHDLAMQPSADVVLESISHNTPGENGEPTATLDDAGESLMDEDPVLPISTPLNEPSEMALPGYVEPAAEPDLPDATAEPAPTSFLTPAVPHAAESDVSARAEPADTRQISPEPERPTTSSAPLPPHEALPDPFLPPPTTDLPQPRIEPNLVLSDSLQSEDGLSQIVVPQVSADGEPAHVTSESSATVSAPPASSPSTSTDTIVAEDAEDVAAPSVDHVDTPEARSDSDDDDMILIEKRRASEPSLQAPISPLTEDPLPASVEKSPSTVTFKDSSPAPRELPERFLASEVFTDPPEELPPSPTKPAADPPSREASTSPEKARSLSYHQHGVGVINAAGPSRIPRDVVSSAHAGTFSTPRRSSARPRASSPTASTQSPVTRSQCVYHVLELPGPGKDRTRFAVPYCSLADAQAIEEEEAKVRGVATPAENERRQALVGRHAVDLDEALDQALTRIVGIDMVKEGHCFFLEQFPARQASSSSAMDTDEASLAERSSPAAVDTSPESAEPTADSTPSGKRKRTGVDEVDEPEAEAGSSAATSTAESSQGDDAAQAAETADASPAKRARLSEEPPSQPPAKRRWSFWPFSR